MRRTPHLLLLPVLLAVGAAGCGGDDGSETRRTAPPASAESAEVPNGVTAAQYGALQLRSPRADVEARLGEPLRVRRSRDGTECLDYRALDDRGAEIETQRYRLCFNEQDQLAVVTARPVAP